MLNINLKLLYDFWVDFLFARQSFDSRLPLAFACLALIFFSGLWVIPLLRKVLDSASLLSIIPMAGLVTLILASFPVFLWSTWSGKSLNFQLILAVLLFLIFLSILLSAARGQAASGSAKALIALACLLLVFCVLRLPFIQGLVLPPYSDSVEHYQIIDDLSHPEVLPLAFYKLERLATRYYHMGFHVLAASLASLTASPIEQVMLVLGQLFQVIIPLSLFFPIKVITKNDLAGLGAVLFAGLCWRMPAFASNWGKYPALTSLSMLPLLPGVFYIAKEVEKHSRSRKLIFVALAAGAATVLAHTRSFVLLGMFFGSWYLSVWIARFQSTKRFLALAVLFLSLFGLGYFINMDSVMSFIFIPYLRDGYLPLILVVLLIPFGLKKYPGLTICTLLILLFILVGSVFPLPAGLGRLGYLYLLDRPFAQVVLFLPLSALGGIGLAGLYEGIKYLRGSILVLPLFTFAALFYSLAYSELAPSSCCQLAGPDDIKAYRWIEDNLPSSAIILIASNQTPTRSYGVDGGAWVTPLTGYTVTMRSNKTPFDSPVILSELCDGGVSYVYVGETAARFSVEKIAIQANWYRNVYASPAVYIYQVIGCR